MEVFTKHFEGVPIRMTSKNGITHMVNIIDVSKIMQINAFEWLQTPEIKEFIAGLETGYESAYNVKPKDRLVYIESSTEVYVHTMIFCKLTFKTHMPLYEWFYSREYVEI